MSKKIRTPQDVADMFGADTPEGISRRVYKGTNCGAWAEVVERVEERVEEREETWTAEFRCLPSGGTRVTHVRKRGRAQICTCSAPQEIRDFLALPCVHFTNSTLTADELKNINPPDPGVCGTKRIWWRAPDVAYITFVTKVKRASPNRWLWKFRVGSIVEGCDQEIDVEEVFLPCAAQDIHDAIQAVEDEAKAIWNDTHGCPKCRMGGAINPTCRSCKGQGQIL